MMTVGARIADRRVDQPEVEIDGVYAAERVDAGVAGGRVEDVRPGAAGQDGIARVKGFLAENGHSGASRSAARAFPGGSLVNLECTNGPTSLLL